MDRKEMNEILADYGTALTVDDYDDCIIGIAERCTKDPLVVYDREKMIEKLAKQFDEDKDFETEDAHTDAVEYFEFNIAGAWMGEGTPLFLTRLEED